MSVVDLLGQEAIDALHRPTAEAWGLPGRAYHSAEFLELERETLFSRSWTAAAMASQIPGHGDVLPVDMAGWPLVFARDRGGGGEVFSQYLPSPRRGGRPRGRIQSACTALPLACLDLRSGRLAQRHAGVWRGRLSRGRGLRPGELGADTGTGRAMVRFSFCQPGRLGPAAGRVPDAASRAFRLARLLALKARRRLDVQLSRQLENRGRGCNRGLPAAVAAPGGHRWPEARRRVTGRGGRRVFLPSPTRYRRNGRVGVVPSIYRRCRSSRDCAATIPSRSHSSISFPPASWHSPPTNMYAGVWLPGGHRAQPASTSRHYFVDAAATDPALEASRRHVVEAVKNVFRAGRGRDCRRAAALKAA